MVCLHMSKWKPYAEEKHIAGTQPDIMDVLVVVFTGQPPVPGPLLLWLSKSRQISGCSGGLGSVQLAWLLIGSSGCSVASGSCRMEVLSISAVHSDSLGVVINFIYLLVCFVVFVLIYHLPS